MSRVDAPIATHEEVRPRIVRAARHADRKPEARPPVAQAWLNMTAATVGMLRERRVRVVLVDYQTMIYDPFGAARTLSALIPCIGQLHPGRTPERRLSTKGGRDESLLHYSRSRGAIIAANRFVTINASVGPALRALGYTPAPPLFPPDPPS